MSAQAAVFRFEFRRHTWTLIVACLSLLGIPLLLSAHGSWRYWEMPGAEPVTTLILYLLAPIVGSWIGAHTWAEDRSERVLEWLIDRPLVPSRLFMIRLLAVAATAGIWFLLAYLVMLPVLRRPDLSLDGIQYSLLLQLTWSLGFGLFFSALAERPGLAFLLSWIGTYTFHIVVIAALVRWGLGNAVSRMEGASHPIQNTWPWISLGLEWFLPVAILLAATWQAVKICPGDARRVGRGLRVLVAGGAGYLAILASLWIWIKA